ncbi:MAG: hypothetical protein ACOYBO_14550 [Azonexus sp.]
MIPFRRAFARAAAPIGVIGAVGGFIGDIIQPLGNFAPYVALLSLLGAIVSFIFLIIERRRKGHDMWDTVSAGLFVMFAASTVIFATWSVVFAAGPERGYLATNIEPIGQVQAQLLGLQKDVTEIKATVLASETQIVVSATAQAQGFAELQREFAALQAGQGTLVANAATPQECYSNARLYQLRGDTTNALKAYECYFGFNLEFVDPFYEYTAVLNATQGIAQTRKTIDDLQRARPDSATLELIATRLLDSPAERIQRLTALAERSPNYGPVFDELGQEYDRAIAGSVTSDLLKRQAVAYRTLLKLEENQLFSRYFIDKAQADTHLQNAHRMLDAFATAAKVYSNVDVQIYAYGSGVQFIVILPEVSNAKQLLFSIDDPDPKTDAGNIVSGAQTFVNTGIGPLPVKVGEHTFYMKFVDANNVTSQVFSKVFRLDAIAVNFQQLPPDFSTNTIPGLFSLAIVGAQGFEPYTFKYSIDAPTLDQSLAGIATESINVKSLAKGDHKLYIQATAEDGKKTDVVEYKFTVR